MALSFPEFHFMSIKPRRTHILVGLIDAKASELKNERPK
ncbi:hypothetical protein SSIN_1359 [Streptococcus sinensis]|uniref:Uncharacterized protein n=1 Tax=Streptococcus sinensis TaxID=176090 RepID=A0A0A0DFL9_9STRE|nr:hypothetical protein SSIN_1359 [Streptococcus sinensis]